MNPPTARPASGGLVWFDEPAPPRATEQLSRERIVAAAIGLADREPPARSPCGPSPPRSARAARWPCTATSGARTGWPTSWSTRSTGRSRSAGPGLAARPARAGPHRLGCGPAAPLVRPAGLQPPAARSRRPPPLRRRAGRARAARPRCGHPDGIRQHRARPCPGLGPGPARGAGHARRHRPAHRRRPGPRGRALPGAHRRRRPAPPLQPLGRRPSPLRARPAVVRQVLDWLLDGLATLVPPS